MSRRRASPIVVAFLMLLIFGGMFYWGIGVWAGNPLLLIFVLFCLFVGVYIISVFLTRRATKLAGRL